MSENDPALCTTNGRPVAEVRAAQTNERGQHAGYIVLCEDERRKGYVRPVRTTYRHVGLAAAKYPLRELTDDEHARFDGVGYVRFEAYPADADEAHGGAVTGRFWTQADLDRVDNGCGATTTMHGGGLAETYARNPTFYGKTFCVRCDRHLPVAEFVWEPDGSRVGS